MKTTLDETKFESGTQAGAAICFETDAAEMAKRLEKSVNDAKAAVSAKLEDGEIAVNRLLKRGRYALEDGMSETAHQIRRHPGRFFAIAFAAGAALGFLVPRAVKK